VDEQCVIIVLDELSCSSWTVSWVLTGPYSTTDDSFDAIPIISRRRAPLGAACIEQFSENDGCVDSLEC